MANAKIWLPPPERGAHICLGFDGSENDDWTALKAETIDGLIFTPRWGPDQQPAIWNPAEWGGRIPRDQVDLAVDEIHECYRVARAYADPGFQDESSWLSQIETWAQHHGESVWIPWPTNQQTRMYAALRRFESDLANGLITQDGCPITQTHMGNARKIAGRADTYRLGKPAQHQKIDAAVTSVLAHEAACDARAEGWKPTDSRLIYLPR